MNQEQLTELVKKLPQHCYDLVDGWGIKPGRFNGATGYFLLMHGRSANGSPWRTSAFVEQGKDPMPAATTMLDNVKHITEGITHGQSGHSRQD
jgi:hypothetical protein